MASLSIYIRQNIDIDFSDNSIAAKSAHSLCKIHVARAIKDRLYSGGSSSLHTIQNIVLSHPMNTQWES